MEIIANSILPVFILVGIGYFLKRRGILKPETEDFLNGIAYYVLLPAMIFMSIYKAEFREIFSVKVIAGIYIASFIVFLTAVAAARMLPAEKRGGFVLPAFRTNIAYIGFPVILNAYGATALAQIGVITGFIAPFLIVLSIIYLNFEKKRRASGSKNVFYYIATDPLVISSVAGILFSYFRIPLPKFLTNTFDMLSSMGTALILIALGAGLKIAAIKKDRIPVLTASAFKIILQPLLAFIIFSYFIRVDDQLLFKVAVMTFTFPSALSTYIMVKQYKSDAEMTASIIMVTTLLSILTMSVWLLILG